MKIALRSVLWLLVASTLVVVSGYSLVGAFNSQPLTFNASASADTYVSTYSPTTSQGTSSILWTSTGNAQVNWTLILFNIVGKLRPSDLVVEAKMRFAISEARASTWPVRITTGRTLTGWSEDTTFSTRPLMGFDTTTLTSIGTSVAPAPGTLVWFDLSKQLKRWHSYGEPSNFGTVMMFEDDVSNAALGLASRENAQLTPPILQVTYQPGPTTVYGYSLDPGPVTTLLARVE